MKDCVHFAPMLGSRDGELSAEDRAALSAHLAGCAQCRALEADLVATEGLVAAALLAQANARDFAPFVDQVMDRVGAADPSSVGAPSVRAERSGRAAAAESRHAPGIGRGILAWLASHRRLLLASAMPVVAAVAVLMYVRRDGGTREVAALEVSAEGDATTVLETSDGPVVLLDELGERS
jgi:anti-sigma factor RsiW